VGHPAERLNWEFPQWERQFKRKFRFRTVGEVSCQWKFIPVLLSIGLFSRRAATGAKVRRILKKAIIRQ
jgi:hypothetical protein